MEDGSRLKTFTKASRPFPALSDSLVLNRTPFYSVGEGNTSDPAALARTASTIIDLDHNLLFLDYDHRFGFRKKETIDLWWRGLGRNTGLMLDLAKFMLSSPDWGQAELKIIVVDDSDTEVALIEQRVQELLDSRRLQGKVKIFRRGTDEKTFYQLMKSHSMETDLVMVGVPEVPDEQVSDYVEHTNDLVGTIGTVLLVAASSKFQSHEIAVKRVVSSEEKQARQYETLPELRSSSAEVDPIISELDKTLFAIGDELNRNALKPASEYFLGFIAELRESLDAHFEKLAESHRRNEAESATYEIIDRTSELSARFRENVIEEIGRGASLSHSGISEQGGGVC